MVKIDIEPSMYGKIKSYIRNKARYPNVSQFVNIACQNQIEKDRKV